MRMPRFAVAILLCALTMRVCAEAPEAAPTVTLMDQLQRFAAGKPIPLVVATYGHQTASLKPLAETAGKAWLPALQALAAIVSPPDGRVPNDEQIQENYIPFQLGKVWTLAPDRQWRLNLDLSGLDMYAASNAEDLKEWLVYSMSPEQMAKAGGEGLRWKDWTAGQQALLSALMRRPFALSGPGDSPSRKPRTAFPVSRSVFRLRMHFENFTLPAPDGRGGKIYGLPTKVPVVGYPVRSDVVLGTDIPYRVAEPAKLKAGDLDFGAEALNVPIGARGVMTLKEAVAAAAKATAQPMKLSPEFDKMPVFIGDSALRTGDVLKALTFGMQGAWRKVGDTYLLAWDRIGRGAVRLWQTEAVQPLDRAASRAKKTMEVWDTDRLLRENVRPDPNDPLAPTPDEISRLLSYGPTDPNTGYPTFEDLTFADMTSAQQDAIREGLKGSLSARYNGMPSDEEMQRLMVRSLLAIGTLDAPGFGVVSLGNMATFFRGSNDPPPPPPKAADWPPKNLPSDDSLVLRQEMRGIAPPMLLRSEWPRLIEQMQRKGLNTLYVPVLWDGHTLFPSRQFPQPDALRGHDALAEILAAAKPANIRVVAVLHTLAWRNLGGSEVHWMRKHRDWLDVDILGRTRREWLTPERLPVGPGDGSDWAEDPAMYADYVRPELPAVREKLMGLVSELRHYPGLDGVALDHWMRTSGRDYSGPAPRLGYTLPQRAAALARTGADPVDVNLLNVAALTNRRTYVWNVDPWEPMTMSGAEGDDLPAALYAEDAALASDMVNALHETWPGRVELFQPLASSGGKDAQGAATVSIAGSTRRPLPKVDALIGSQPVAGQPGQYRWLPAPKMTDDGTADDRRFARAAIRMQRLATPVSVGQKPLAGVVLDFTTAPDPLWSCLRLLKR